MQREYLFSDHSLLPPSFIEGNSFKETNGILILCSLTLCNEKVRKVYLHSDYRDDDLRSLLMEALDTFGRLNENSINHIVTIFHYLGKIDAGNIRLSQGDVYSLKWEANVADLREEGFVGIEQKGYREYYLVKNQRMPNEKNREIWDEVRKMNSRERRKIALHLHYALSKKGEMRLPIKELAKLLSNVRRGHSSST